MDRRIYGVSLDLKAYENYNRSKCSESFLIAVTFKGKVVKNGKLEDPGTLQ